MYTIKYTKHAVGDIPELKAAHLVIIAVEGATLI